MHSLAVVERAITVALAKNVFTQFMRRATILVYHNIASTHNKALLQSDSVVLHDFEHQMQLLRDNSFNVMSLQELVMTLATGKAILQKTVVLTFDDGYKSTYTAVLPILVKHNLPATIYLAVASVGQSSPFSWLLNAAKKGGEDLTPMTWNEVREIRAAGFEIGSHSYTHAFLPKMDTAALENELFLSQAIIADKLAQPPQAFALPYSYPVVHRQWPTFRGRLIKALKKCKYTSCSTLRRGYISARTDPYLLDRIVIGKYDDLKSFHAKLLGCYAWTRIPQFVFQSFFKNYDCLQLI